MSSRAVWRLNRDAMMKGQQRPARVFASTKHRAPNTAALLSIDAVRWPALGQRPSGMRH